MIIKNLYRYKENDWSVTITLHQRNQNDQRFCYRLIADENKILVKDDITVYCIDTDTIDGWQEIDDDSEDIDLNEKGLLN